MKIIVPPHPALSSVAGSVPHADLRKKAKLILEMKQAMTRGKGIGLAANQVGILERIIVWRLPTQTIAKYAINPTFVPGPASTRRKGTEGCLSLPGQTGRVMRWEEGDLIFNTLKGDEIRMHGAGLLARVWQHEIDHLDGITFPERIATQ